MCKLAHVFLDEIQVVLQAAADKDTHVHVGEEGEEGQEAAHAAAVLQHSVAFKIKVLYNDNGARFSEGSCSDQCQTDAMWPWCCYT